MKIFASLYTDEDIANLVATLLKTRGLDVLTTLDAGMTGYSDDRQLAYAVSEERCLLTHNRVDFDYSQL
jgi:predicted nuclease of predicted toxin-antitoxin system